MRHAEHVELTWKLLGDAFAELEKRLSSLAAAAGKPEKYDRELTRAFFELIAARRREGESWDEFVARNSDLFTRGRELLTARSKLLIGNSENEMQQATGDRRQATGNVEETSVASEQRCP